MPRPTWNGFLRLSLVSCPISLSPATTESERIRLNQLNPKTGNRISLQPVDSETGDAVERADVVKGYQYEKGQYVTLEPEELDEIQVESSRILDLETFVARSSVDPLYIGDPYFIYPDKTGVEAFRVICQAMTNRKQAAIGRIVLSTREHMVLVEPQGPGLLMSLLRAADEVRTAEYDIPSAKLDPKMIDLAETIIERQAGKFDPAQFHDRYQDALRELIEAKVKGLPKQKRRVIESPSNVVDLMAALKKSLAGGGGKSDAPAAAVTKKRARKPDPKQRNMLLPVKGGGNVTPIKQTEKAHAKRRRG